ncbi:unnamed protein product [Colletotrichum noveboracense]|uniref:Extracellular membrane protein CFEM domain-containing protein n=1 Tax=Colletotrichum noveboracense TaxID=2664923 RepID=A0A9W4S3X3_9PEZI|nr:unnamed protein product [Colletotrichum noveboracense]
MRAAAVFLAAVIRVAYAQDKDDIPRCSWDCLGLTPSDTCHIRIDPECACGVVVTDARRSQLGSCVGTYCKDGTTFDDGAGFNSDCNPDRHRDTYYLRYKPQYYSRYYQHSEFNADDRV